MNLQRKLYREKIEARMLFKEEEEARDPFSNWPAAFYEEKNPEKRESLVLLRMQQEAAERQVEEDRLSVLYERYPVLKERREKEGSSRKQGLFSREAPLVDLYMYSWMNILIRGRNGIHFWNRSGEASSELPLFFGGGRRALRASSQERTGVLRFVLDRDLCNGQELRLDGIWPCPDEGQHTFLEDGGRDWGESPVYSGEIGAGCAG